MSQRNSLRLTLALILFAMYHIRLQAQPKLEFGKSYFFVSESAVTRCGSDGIIADGASPIDAPANSIFRLVDTLRTGEAVIRFWKWHKDDPRRSAFNYEVGDSTLTAYFFNLPKTSRNKLKEQGPKSPTNGQHPIDAPSAPPKNEYNQLDTSRYTLGRDRSFIYSIGTNFDFIDDVQTSKTYHDLRAWVPKLSIADSGFCSIFGFEFGFNRFRTVSTPDSSEAEYRDVRGSQVIQGPDTSFVLSFYTNTVKDKVVSRFDNVGLMLNPMIRLSGHSRKDVFFALVANFEWQRSVLDRTVTRNYSEVVTDAAPEDWEIPYTLNYDALPSAQENFRTTTHNFYAAPGFRLMFRDNFGTFNLRAAIGYAYQLTTFSTEALLAAREAVFYNLHAEIIESKVSGVKLGAEIRGFFDDEPTDPAFALPRLSVYIAKEFQLRKIAELLKS